MSRAAGRRTTKKNEPRGPETPADQEGDPAVHPLTDDAADTNLNAMLDAAIQAVIEASHATRRVQDELGANSQFTKDDRSPVTIADFAGQALVAIALDRALHTPLRMVGEEDADTLRDGDNEALRNNVFDIVRTVEPDATDDQILDGIDLGNYTPDGDEGYWTLDPIDGTKGFLRGQQYAVALAYIERGEVVLGVMGCPRLNPALDPETPPAADAIEGSGVIFCAARGRGAVARPLANPDANAVDVRARVSPRVDEAIHVCESVEAAHTRHDRTATILDSLDRPRHAVRLDSQAKYGVVAMGVADAYLRLPAKRGYIEKIWDHAAGDIIAREAGAVVTDVTGKRLDFGHGGLLSANRGVVCASPDVHAALVRTIADLGYDVPPPPSS